GEDINDLNSSWFTGAGGMRERIRKIDKFGGRTLIGLYEYYQNLYKGIKGDYIIDIMRIRLGIGVKRYTLDSFLRDLEKSRYIQWRHVTDLVIYEVLEMLANEYKMPAAALRTRHLEKGLKGHDIRQILTKYFRRGIGKEYAFLALKKKVGIPSLTADYIIDCFKNGKKPYWNGVYSNKERGMLVEMLANELGKSPNELKPYDFRRGVKVFYGKSLVGLAVHYRSPEGRFGEEEVAQMLER
ncbi:unnamed protein product, partial [marine sediment metagenome]